MYTYKLGGMLITDELYHDDLEVMTFGRKDQNELMHYGIKGQSWGKRRFQNEDGSLTMAGRNRYDVGNPLQGSTNRAMAANRTYATGGGTGGFGGASGGGGNSGRFGGASGGGGSVTPKGSPTIRTYGSFMTPGGKSYEFHDGPGQSAGRTVTNKVKAKVNDTVNSGRKAADNLFGRIGDWASNAAKDVGKAATNAYNDVSKAAGDAVNWVGDRARDVGNLVSNQDEKRAAENAQNVADRVLEDAIARSGEYVPDEKGGEDLYIRDYNDAKVVDAADKRAADAQQAYENHPLTKIQNAVNDVKNLFSDGSKEREALAEARSKVDKYADDPEFMSYFYKDNPEEAKRFADEQIEARKQLKQAENNYMDFSNNPVNTVSRALNLPNNKGNWAFAVPGNEQYLQTMKTGFIPKTENIGDWFTGNNYKRTADTHNQFAKDYDDLAEQAYAYGRESAETGRGPSKDWWNREGDYIKNVYAKEDRDIANANMNLYNNAPRQKIVNAANQVGETITNAAQGVGNWAGNAAKDVTNWGGQQVENGKKLFKKIFG